MPGGRDTETTNRPRQPAFFNGNGKENAEPGKFSKSPLTASAGR
jgi:hypothetical protein